MKIKDKFKTKQEFEMVLNKAMANAENSFEQDFCWSLDIRYKQHGIETFLSDRQEQVLDQIAYRSE